MTIEVSTILPVSPDRVWTMVNRPALLHYVAWPLLTFEAVDPPAFPDRWEERQYHVRIKAFGLVPLGSQIIEIERSVDPETATHGEPVRRLRDNGRGTILRRWDHWITVEPAGTAAESTDSGRGEGRATRYTDRVDVDAGVLTPLAGGLARVFYAHRQRRWHRLLAEDDGDEEESALDASASSH